MFYIAAIAKLKLNEGFTLNTTYGQRKALNVFWNNV